MRDTQTPTGLVEKIITTFQNEHNSRAKAIKTKHLLSKLGCIPQTFREVLGDIRRNTPIGEGFIVSDVNKGYWYTEDRAELNDFLQRQLNRIANQYANVQSLHQSLKSNQPKTNHIQQSLFN